MFHPHRNEHSATALALVVDVLDLRGGNRNRTAVEVVVCETERRLATIGRPRRVGRRQYGLGDAVCIGVDLALCFEEARWDERFWLLEQTPPVWKLPMLTASTLSPSPG